MNRQRLTSDTAISVVVADNTLIHTELLADVLRRNRDLKVITSGSDAKSVIDTTLEQNVDVLVVSSNLADQADSGFEVVRQLRASLPRLRIVVLLDWSKEELTLEAFRAGAHGVLSRFESIKVLYKCVRCVNQGQIWANSQHMSLGWEHWPLHLWSVLRM
jgi:DNA-binding NarL/FixJ family response regulator